MSEEVQSQKKCSVEEGRNEDATPRESEGDTENENITKGNMEGNKRSSPRKKDPKDTGPVALEETDLGKRGKTKGDDGSKGAEDRGEGKRKFSQSEDEEYVPEPPTKRRRLFKSVKENLPSEENFPVSQAKPAKGKRGVKRAAKRITPKKSRAPKKAKAQEDEDEFEVEKIVKVKMLRNGKREFLIRWKGFSSEHDTWEPEANLTCKELVNQYFEEHKEAIDAPGDGDKKSTGGKSERRGSSRLSRSRKADSAADAESSAKKSTKKGRRNSKQSRGKGKKKQTRARSAGAKRGKGGAAVTQSKKDGNAETKKREKDEGEETKQNRGKSTEAEETGQHGGTSESEDRRGYEIERIVDVRQPKEGDREFLIKWRGYPNKFNSWESAKSTNCSEKIEKFLKSMEQNSTERELRVVRKKTNRFVADDGGRGRKTSLRLEKMPRKSYSEID